MINLAQIVVLSLLLFGIGLVGFFRGQDLIRIVLAMEIMLNSVNLFIATFTRAYGFIEGELIVLILMALGAAEIALGLAVILLIEKRTGSLKLDGNEKN